VIDDRMVIAPPEDGTGVKIVRGPNIKPLPINNPLPETIKARVLLVVEDNITTDHILPGGSKVLPLRSNIEAISEYVFAPIDPHFAAQAREYGSGIIVAGENYGQGSSREHAALAPMYLGIKVVLAKSFARIHHANLVNFGILPLVFVDERDYDNLAKDDQLIIEDVARQLKNDTVIIKHQGSGNEIKASHSLSKRLLKVVLAGGLLNYTRQSS
jgi:aconitate hydratase